MLPKGGPPVLISVNLAVILLGNLIEIRSETGEFLGQLKQGLVSGHEVNQVRERGQNEDDGVQRLPEESLQVVLHSAVQIAILLNKNKV